MQVETLQEADKAALVEPPPTLPSHEAFLQLCTSPPLQVHPSHPTRICHAYWCNPTWVYWDGTLTRSPRVVQGPHARLEAPPYQVLQHPPVPGMLLGIDAEFVALAPAEKVMQR